MWVEAGRNTSLRISLNRDHSLDVGLGMRQLTCGFWGQWSGGSNHSCPTYFYALPVQIMHLDPSSQWLQKPFHLHTENLHNLNISVSTRVISFLLHNCPYKSQQYIFKQNLQNYLYYYITIHTSQWCHQVLSRKRFTSDSNEVATHSAHAKPSVMEMGRTHHNTDRC